MHLLADYLEQLQPWIEDVSSNVHSLLSQDPPHVTISSDDSCNHNSAKGQVIGGCAA